MTSPNLFVIDTNSLIAYFHVVFQAELRLSNRAMRAMQLALSSSESAIKISIPSIVFVEIFEKWLRNEEFARKFFYEVYMPIKESPNIEIRPIDREILEVLRYISGGLANHDLNDKIVLASAISLGCRLISTDEKLIKYVKKTHIIPDVIN